MRDTITLGFLSGLIGNIAKDISNFFIWKADKTELTYGHLAASMFSEPAKTRETGNFLVGQAMDMVVGAALGIPMVYLLKKTGKDNYLLKGAGAGLVLWGLLYGLGPNLNFYSIKPKKTKTHFSALWNNLLYGAVAAQTAVLIADPDLFPGKDRKNNGYRHSDG